MNAVDRLYSEAESILTSLTEISLKNAASDHFRKALLLASASSFESILQDHVLRYIDDCSGQSDIIRNFVRNKAVERQYHTWFDWEKKNANKFFALFGDDFKTRMKNKLQDSDALQESVRSFMEIGSERNRLVHQDYATFQLEKTLEEIYDLYKRALVFVELFPSVLRENTVTL